MYREIRPRFVNKEDGSVEKMRDKNEDKTKNWRRLGRYSRRVEERRRRQEETRRRGKEKKRRGEEEESKTRGT